jgi:O-antigen/teichoic acid export membrane protein
MFEDKKYQKILKVMYGSSILVFILNFVTHIIIARILAPEKMGLFALMLIIESLLLVLVEFGIASRIIQNKQITKTTIEKYYNYTIMSGITFGLVLTMIILAISFYVNINLAWYIVAPILILDSALIVPIAYYRKEIDFKNLSLIYLYTTLALFILSTIFLLIFKSIIGALFAVFLSKIVLFILVNRKHQLRFSFILSTSLLRNEFKILSEIFGSEAFNIISAKVDDLLVNFYFGHKILGLYNVSWNLMLIPIVRINSVINEVSFPYYQTIKSQNEILDHYLRNLLFCILLGTPLLLVLNLNAADIVALLYGSEWKGLTPYIEVMSLIGISKLINNPGGGLLLSMNRNRELLAWNTVWLIVILLIFGIGGLFANEVLILLWIFLIFSAVSNLAFHKMLFSKLTIRLKYILPHLLFLISCLICYLIAQQINTDNYLPFISLFYKSSLFICMLCVLVLPLNWLFKKHLK